MSNNAKSEPQVHWLVVVLLAYVAGILTAVVRDPLFSTNGVLDDRVFGMIIVALALSFLFWLVSQIEHPEEKG